MRDLELNEIHEVSGGLTTGIGDSLLGGVGGLVVGAANGLWSGAKRGAAYCSGADVNNPAGVNTGLGGLLTGAFDDAAGVIGGVLGALAGAVGGAVGGLGAGIIGGKQEVNILVNYFNGYLNPAQAS